MCTHLKNSIKESCKNRQLSREPFLVISCTLHHVDAPWTMYRGMSVCVGVLAGCLQMALALCRCAAEPLAARPSSKSGYAGVRPNNSKRHALRAMTSPISSAGRKTR